MCFLQLFYNFADWKGIIILCTAVNSKKIIKITIKLWEEHLSIAKREK